MSSVFEKRENLFSSTERKANQQNCNFCFFLQAGNSSMFAS